MTTTSGQRERSQWGTSDPRSWFVQDAIAARGYRVYEGEDDPEPEPEVFNASADPDHQPAGGRRSPHSDAAAMTAIADAMGMDVAELDDISFSDAFDFLSNETSDPQAAFDAIADQQARDGSPTWRADAEAFAASKGMTNKRSAGHVRPSRTPEARRQRHIRTKAERLGVTYAEAERLTPRRMAGARQGPATPP